MKRMGRPKVDDPKSKNITVRIDKETEEKLETYCAYNGVSRSEAIRRGVHLLPDTKER